MKSCSFTLTALLLFIAFSVDSSEIDIHVSERGVGHAWAVIKCTDRRAKISFGPADPNDIAIIFSRVPSTNDYRTGKPTVSHSIRLNEAECRSMIEQVKSIEGTQYRLLLYNCSTAVLEVLKAGGINLYADQGGLKQYLALTFSTPSSLASELRTLKTRDIEASQRREKEIKDRMRWRCNYKNVLHPFPRDCHKPELGGSWEVMP